MNDQIIDDNSTHASDQAYSQFGQYFRWNLKENWWDIDNEYVSQVACVRAAIYPRLGKLKAAPGSNVL